MEKTSIKKNYIYNTLYQILTLLIPLITTPYASHIFEADGIGIQSYTNSIVSIFIIFASFGTAKYGQREIARNRDDKEKASKLFWEIELLNIACTSITLIVWLAFVLITDQYKMIYTVLSMQIIAVAFDISWFYGGYEKFKFITIRNVIVKIIGIIILFASVHTKSDLLLYIGLTSATGLIGNISMWTYLRKFICKVKIKDLNVKSHFKSTLVFFIPTIATSIYTILDKTMIGVITKDNAENGYYEQANKIVNMAKTIAISLNTVMYARMSYMFVENKIKEMKELLNKSLHYMFTIGVPMVLGIMGIAKNLVPWFFGDGYEKVSLILYFNSPLVLIVGLSECIGIQYLTPSGQRARSSKAVIIGAVVNFCLNLLMIPFIKSIGAAIASIFAELIIFILYVYMTDKFVTWKEIFKISYKKFIAGIVMLIVILFIGNICNATMITTIIQITVGAIIYAITMLLLKDEFVLEYSTKYWNKFKQKLGVAK